MRSLQTHDYELVFLVVVFFFSHSLSRRKAQLMTVDRRSETSRVRVAVRLRDMQEDRFERGIAGLAPCVSFAPPNEVHFRDIGSSAAATPSSAFVRTFHVDHCLEASSSNYDVFAHVVQPQLPQPLSSASMSLLKQRILQSKRSLSENVLCFLAYGHTSSGKTHTIAGSTTGEPGLLTLCAYELLKRFPRAMITVTMMEVYAESAFDMLNHNEVLRIRRKQAPSQRGGITTVFEGLTHVVVKTPAEWDVVVQKGLACRRSASMELNERSSRSHAVFTLEVASDDLHQAAHICFVDLAGSERQSIFTKQLNRESIAINKSLSRLSTVLQALGSAAKPNHSCAPRYVNFRDTTLTVVLQRYLVAGSSASFRTTFIACVHPNPYFSSETLATLRYTTRLLRIATSKQHHDGDDATGGGDVNLDSLAVMWSTEMALLKSKLEETVHASKQRDAAHHDRINELERAHRLVEQRLQSLFEVSVGGSVGLLTPSQSLFNSRSSSVLSVPNEATTPIPLNHNLHHHDAAGSVSIALSDISDVLTPSASADVVIANRNGLHHRRGSPRKREVKKMAAWLLSRCISHLNPFSAHFDSYFHEILPLSVTCIGYLTTSSNPLFPRDATDDDDVRLGWVDVGDMVLGLSMLDAGVPPLVGLHDARTCSRPHHWESCDLLSVKDRQHASTLGEDDHEGVFVLAMFDVPSSFVEALDDENEGLCGCRRFSSCESMVPFAIVFAVSAHAPLEHHEAVFQHLHMLQQNQEAVASNLADADSIVTDQEVEHPVAVGTVPNSSTAVAPTCDRGRDTREPLADWGSPSPLRNPPTDTTPFRADERGAEKDDLEDEQNGSARRALEMPSTATIHVVLSPDVRPIASAALEPEHTFVRESITSTSSSSLDFRDYDDEQSTSQLAVDVHDRWGCPPQAESSSSSATSERDAGVWVDEDRNEHDAHSRRAEITSGPQRETDEEDLGASIQPTFTPSDAAWRTHLTSMEEVIEHHGAAEGDVEGPLRHSVSFELEEDDEVAEPEVTEPGSQLTADAAVVSLRDVVVSQSYLAFRSESARQATPSASPQPSPVVEAADAGSPWNIDDGVKPPEMASYHSVPPALTHSSATADRSLPNPSTRSTSTSASIAPAMTSSRSATISPAADVFNAEETSRGQTRKLQRNSKKDKKGSATESTPICSACLLM